MKGILEFDLPEDEHAFYVANNGIKYYNALWEIMNNFIRNKIKHGNYNKETNEVLEELKRECWEVVENLLD